MDILAFIQALINLDEVQVLAALMVANFFSGILSSFVTKTWDWGKMQDIWRRVGGLFATYLVMSVPAYYISWWGTVQAGIFVFLSGFLVEKILKNLNEMGIPVPASISGLPIVKQVVSAVGIGAGLVTSLPGRLVKK